MEWIFLVKKTVLDTELGSNPEEEKKGLLLFDYACHPCTGTMLIFSVYLSVCLMSRPGGRTTFSDFFLFIYLLILETNIGIHIRFYRNIVCWWKKELFT